MKPFVLAGSWSSRITGLLVLFTLAASAAKSVQYTRSTISRPPQSASPEQLSEEYLYVHHVGLKSIKLFKLFIKRLCWINTKKVAASGKQLQNDRLIYYSRIFVFLHHLRPKTNSKEWKPSKKGCLVVHLPLIFPSSSTCRRCTRHKKHLLCYHFYKNMTTTGRYPAWFLCHPVSSPEAWRVEVWVGESMKNLPSSPSERP